MVENFFKIGREPIAQIMFQKYRIRISDHQVCRIMCENNLSCDIRVARKTPEKKNTNVNIPNLVKRDYDNKNHNQIISQLM